MTDVSVNKMLEDQVTCPICAEIPRLGPLFQCCNGHLICEACFLQLSPGKPEESSCPTCRGSYVVVEGNPQRNLLATKLIDTIPLPCTFSYSGCSEVMLRDELSLHEMECLFGMRRCKFEADGCDAEMNATEMLEHENQCGFRTIQCRNEAFGCEEKMRASEEEDHLKNCHYTKISKKFVEMRVEHEMMQVEISFLRSQINALSKAVVLNMPILKRQFKFESAVKERGVDVEEYMAATVEGARVMRGPDWETYPNGERDGGAGGEGTVVGALNDDGYVRVQWDSSEKTFSYCMGACGHFEVQLADS